MKFQLEILESPVCIAHKLNLPYDSPCNQLHGHNYSVRVVISSHHLNDNGMVIDFSQVKQIIKKYDHAFLGDMEKAGVLVTLPTNTHQKSFPEVSPSTAERFAQVLFMEIDRLLKFQPAMEMTLVAVEVWETPNNKVKVTA